MGKQYNKILKRRRRQRYIKRKKLAAKLARQATQGEEKPAATGQAPAAEPAAHASAPAAAGTAPASTPAETPAAPATGA
ncbi:hypothetical protein [Limisphaera sp. 4302-co]|uniref:hypothetical protein n=1 Tax=Limisphaera sp. 4302-co TaxID=3400417 RepID=UPI003C27BF43